MSTDKDRYEALIVALPQTLIRVDRQGNILDSFQGPASRHSQLFDSGTIFSNYGQERGLLFMDRIGRAFESDQIQTLEFAARSRVNIYYEAKFIRVDNEEVLIVITDITAQREQNIILRKSEELFKSVFACSPNPTALIHPEGHFLRVNSAFCAMLGYYPEELEGADCLSITHPEDREESNVHRVKILNDPLAGPQRLSKRYLHRDGHIIWADITALLVRDGIRKPLHFISQIRDITVEKETYDRLEYLVSERTKELQATNETLASFAYAASHDLREPLNKISAFSLRLLERYGDRLDDKGRQYLDVMRSAALRMTSLIDDLLEYSRTGKDSSFKEPVSICKVLAEVLFDLDGSIQAAKAEIVVGDLPVVWAHTTHIRRVLQNLLSNAIKFRKVGVPLKVTIEGVVDKDQATITITDNGIGFSNEKAEHIFVLFTRLHSRVEYPGTGVGLALCRKILSQYNGTIVAKGEPDVGSTFTIRIPVGGPDEQQNPPGSVR